MSEEKKERQHGVEKEVIEDILKASRQSKPVQSEDPPETPKPEKPKKKK